MPNVRRTLLAALAALVLVLVATALNAQNTERFSLSGNAIAVYNLAGSVRVAAGSGAAVVVEVTRGGDDASDLKIERREVNGRAALVVRYPEGRDVVYNNSRWGGQSTVNVRDDGTFFDEEGDRGRRVTIRNSGRGTEAHADLRILVPAGRSVAVRLAVGDVSAAGVNGDLDINVGSAPVETSSTRGALRVDTGSGRVRVTDAEGDVIVDTGSGGVELSGVRGNEVSVDTGSGAVTGNGITAANLAVDTGSGHVDLTAVAAPALEVDTGSGAVVLQLTTDVDRVRIDTGSGAVRLAVPADLGASLHLETGSGGISADVPITITERERDHLIGRIGDGKGTIEIDTGSGAVRITRR